VDKVERTVIEKRLVVEIARVFLWIIWNRWLLELTHLDNIHGWRTSLRQDSFPRLESS